MGNPEDSGNYNPYIYTLYIGLIVRDFSIGVRWARGTPNYPLMFAPFEVGVCLLGDPVMTPFTSGKPRRLDVYVWMDFFFQQKSPCLDCPGTEVRING